MHDQLQTIELYPSEDNDEPMPPFRPLLQHATYLSGLLGNHSTTSECTISNQLDSHP